MQNSSKGAWDAGGSPKATEMGTRNFYARKERSLPTEKKNQWTLPGAGFLMGLGKSVMGCSSGGESGGSSLLAPSNGTKGVSRGLQICYKIPSPEPTRGRPGLRNGCEGVIRYPKKGQTGEKRCAGWLQGWKKKIKAMVF